MNENWCKEHQVEWFKKGAMKNYAHPLFDENGEKTGQWCNKPKDKQSTKVGDSDGRTESIESQVAVKASVDLWIADKIKGNDPMAISARVWIMEHIGNVASIEEPDNPDESSAKEVLATKAQLNRILEIQQIKGIPVTMIADKIKEWGKEKAKDLTSKQADDLIKILEKS